jgi:hypothetical protein
MALLYKLQRTVVIAMWNFSWLRRHYVPENRLKGEFT